MSYPRVRSLWLRYFHQSMGLIDVTLVIEDGVVIDRRMGFERVSGVDSHVDLSRVGIAIPGAIDIHEHLRGLELEYKEDEVSGSLAAAKGGFTAVLDMPNTKPEVRSVAIAKEKLERLSKCVVDYGLFVGLSNPRELVEMLKLEGVAGVKIYPKDLELLNRDHLDVLRKLGSLLVVHAEHPKLIREGCEAGERWICRPIDAELAAVNYVTSLGTEGVRVHVTHVTNVATLNLAKKAGFTVDTCPHYILLSSVDEARLGCLAKVNPPLRPPEVVTELARNLHLVDAFSTDHAPHTVEEKCMDFNECPSGIASNEIAIALTLNLVNRGVLMLDDVVRLWSTGPARVLGIDRWGCIDRGCVASYTLIRMDKEVVVKPEEFVSKSKVSPYAGAKLMGCVVATLCRGRIVYLEGEFFETCCGKPIRVGQQWLSSR